MVQTTDIIAVHALLLHSLSLTYKRSESDGSGVHVWQRCTIFRSIPTR